ncbi:MAG: diguanylate cyclase (GGDEF)-like protein [Polaribacter sp.]|jgi:diguanylate cyclase (GGDEF)-like protein
MIWRRSIKNRLILIILTICISALGLGMLAIGINNHQSKKGAMIKGAISQAQLLSELALEPILNNEFAAVSTVLQNAFLDTRSSGAIFDAIGQQIAIKESLNGKYISSSEYKSANKVRWGSKFLYVWQVIEKNNELAGVVYLQISRRDFDKQTRTYYIYSLVVLLILSFIIYFVAQKMQKSISSRIVNLEQISRRISHINNYAIRVPNYGEDEIGSLARSFNLMLETIEKNQHEKDRAHEALQINRRRLESAVKDLQYLANYDSLTQLPNRALCMDRIKIAIKAASRENIMMAVMFLDLDHFKDVNDSLGHAIGDDLLRSTSQRLQEHIREDDTLARLGGDEFVIILNRIKKTERVIDVVEKIVAGFDRPFDLSGFQVNSTVSIGVCLYPGDGVDVDSLMKSADAAMYKAKEAGRNTYEFYESHLNQLANRRHQLANELRSAIKNDELNLVFQPQLNLAKNEIIGAEALVRWVHPILGNISPAEFIPVAENTGMIKEIGDWVLDQACMVLAKCLQSQIIIRIAINLSALQFKQADLASTISKTLKAYRIPPHLLEVEITESMVMRDVNKAIGILEDIKKMNIRIAIDDFGTGYSSLSYLRRFPLDALKIDQSFVDELFVDNGDTAITLAIISMAKSLRLEVIAEGVETKEQFEFLAKNHCDDIQGYFFSKPLKEEAFIKFLSEHKTKNDSCDIIFA